MALQEAIGVPHKKRQAIELVILRRTRVLASLLPTVGDLTQAGTNALGDWYVNRIYFGRQPILLMVSAESLLPIVIPAKDVRSLPDRLSSIVAARLLRCGVTQAVIDAEIDAMAPVMVAQTASRSVLGIMTDFKRMASYRYDSHDLPIDLDETADRLEHTPCFAGRHDTLRPDVRTLELLYAKWAPESPVPKSRLLRLQ